MKRTLITLLLPLLLLSITACDAYDKMVGDSKPPPLPGERLEVMPELSSFVPDESLADAPLLLPDPSNQAEWPQHGGGEFPGVWHPELHSTLATQSEVTIGEGEAYDYNMVIPPIVANGRVFAMDAMGALSVHAADDIGNVIWTSTSLIADDEEQILGGGLAYAEGIIVATTGKGVISAINAETGRDIWRQDVGIPMRSAPRVADGRVYAVSIDSQLFVLDQQNGELLWTHRGVDEGVGFLIEASPVISQDIVIAPYSSGEIYAMFADDGSPLWSDALMAPKRTKAASVFIGIGGNPVIADNVVYVGGSAGITGAFVLPTGRRIWEQPISTINTPWVVGEAVYVLSSAGKLICLNRLDGRVRWTQNIPLFENEVAREDPIAWFGPVLAGGKLRLVGSHGEMLDINPETGEKLYTYEIPEGIYMSPVIADGRMFLVSREATLYAFE